MIRGGNVRHFLWDVLPVCQSRFSPLLLLVCLPWKRCPRPIAGAGDCLAPLFSRVAIWAHADEVSNVSWLTSVIWPDRQRRCLQHWPPQLLLFKESAADLWPVRDSGMPTITPHARIKLTICNLYRLNTSASREKHNQPGRVPQEINSKGSQPFFSLSPVLDSSTGFLDFILQLLCTHSISLSFFFFNTYDFVSRHYPFSFSLSPQHCDILLGRDFHYLRSGTIYQRMGSSHLVWLTGGSSLYWISVMPFSTTPASKSYWWQV